MSTMPYSDALKAVASRKAEVATHLLEDAANSLLNGAVDDGRAFLFGWSGMMTSLHRRDGNGALNSTENFVSDLTDNVGFR